MPEVRPVIFAAGTLIPVSSFPVPDGAVLVEGGRIRAVGPLSEVGRENPDAEVRFFPNYTLIPGAVNAHAHLGFRRKDAPEGATPCWKGRRSPKASRMRNSGLLLLIAGLSAAQAWEKRECGVTAAKINFEVYR